jgi:hypothetical protein
VGAHFFIFLFPIFGHQKIDRKQKEQKKTPKKVLFLFFFEFSDLPDKLIVRLSNRFGGTYKRARSPSLHEGRPLYFCPERDMTIRWYPQEHTWFFSKMQENGVRVDNRGQGYCRSDCPHPGLVNSSWRETDQEGEWQESSIQVQWNNKVRFFFFRCCFLILILLETKTTTKLRILLKVKLPSGFGIEIKDKSFCVVIYIVASFLHQRTHCSISHN